MSFFPRFWMAIVCFFRILFRPKFAQQIEAIVRAWRSEPSGEQPSTSPGRGTSKGRSTAPELSSAATRSERAHASGLFVLGLLQREGRLLDFLQEEVAPFTDAEVGAAARVVHQGCRNILMQHLTLKPILSDSEGANVTVPDGFDAQRIRLTGNIAGKPPFKGSLKHHGWVASEVRLPSPPDALDPRILAPAEVELP